MSRQSKTSLQSTAPSMDNFISNVKNLNIFVHHAFVSHNENMTLVFTINGTHTPSAPILLLWLWDLWSSRVIGSTDTVVPHLYSPLFLMLATWQYYTQPIPNFTLMVTRPYFYLKPFQNTKRNIYITTVSMFDKTPCSWWGFLYLYSLPKTHGKNHFVWLCFSPTTAINVCISP